MTIPTLQAAGQWTTTIGDLPAASSWYGQHDGAILLKNNQVLVIGGADQASAARAEAALYDPTPKTWAATGNLQTARRLYTATRLDDEHGKVLVVGGITGSAQFPAPGLATAELYDPVAGTWSATGSLHGGRWGHSAVLLPNKSVLVTGGCAVRSPDQSLKALRSAELYDPGTGEWLEVEPMTDARSGHPAVVLDKGRVLVCGGTAPIAPEEDAALAYCEIYDSTANTWTATGTMLAARSWHQATLISPTAVLVTGGRAPGAPGDGTFDPFSRDSAERYDLGTGKWTAVTPMPGGRALHRAVALGSGNVLVIGGTDNARNDAGYQSVLIFNSSANSWAVTDGLSTGRWAFAATVLSDGQVLVTGGTVRSGLAAASPDVSELTVSTEVFDPAGGTP
jgi:N-acetylneuraminic acid mutarotase